MKLYNNQALPCEYIDSRTQTDGMTKDKVFGFLKIGRKPGGHKEN